MLVNLLENSCNSCPARELSFFKDIHGNDVECLNMNKRCSKLKKGQFVFNEGGKPLGIHCIQQGKVKMYKTSQDGKEQIMYFAQPGDFLGYRALIAEESLSMTAEVMEDSVICFIPQDSFFYILENNPEVSKKMMKALCHELNVASEKIKSMAQKTVRERLAETLLLLQETFRMPNDKNDTIINITLPREDIANLVGTATETVIRLLSEMRDDKLIEFEGKKIRLLNQPKLKRLAEMV
jgi:CRP-like cAMP-binding protein